MSLKGKEVIFLAIIFVAFFHMLELAYRGYQKVVYGIPFFITTERDDPGNPVALARSIVVGHPLFHYVLNPELTGHTKEFYRKTPEVNGATITVFCLGGSSTYGTGLTIEQSFPARLRAHLAEKGKHVKVMNGGVPGWGLPHFLARYLFDLRERKPRPSLLVLYFGYNDLWSNVARPGLGYAHSDGLKHFPDKLPAWMSYRFLVWVFSKTKTVTGWHGPPTHMNDFAFVPVNDVGYLDEDNLRRLESELDFLLQNATADGIRTLLVLQDVTNPHMGQEQRIALEAVQERIRRVASRRSAPLFDSRDATKGKKEMFFDEIHHSPLGADAFARWLAEHLVHLRVVSE